MVIGRILIVFTLLLILSVFSFGESFEIRNIGQLGFNDSNQEFTPIKVVNLHSTLDDNATKCRYNETNVAWTNFENCKQDKYWVLSDGEGLKTVNAQINHTNGSIYNYSDTIMFNHTGFGLDLTPPTNVNITYDRFTNSNNSISIEFDDAIDPESNILKIPLVYTYDLFINDVLNISGDASLNVVNFNLSANQTFNQSTNITIRIITKNSAGLNSTTYANITIDYTLPSNVIINSSISQNNWTSNTSIFFNWSAYDNISGIYGYSYSFTEDNSVLPDDSLEIDENDNYNFTNTTFSNINTINTGKYYFKIKARDSAKNFGNVSNYSVWIDTNPPSKPIITSFEKVYGTNTTNFTWSESFDFESGISNYTIEFSNISNFSNIIHNHTTSNNSTFYYNYNSSNDYDSIYARVYATDKVGNIGHDSSEDATYDTTAPIITLIRPNGNVNSNLPTIALYTDEKAVCYVKKQDNSYEKFLFTNDTFHETQPDETTTGTQYNIKCEDMYGNEKTTTASFTYSGSINSATISASSGYLGKNVEINMTSNVGNIDKDKIKVYVDSVDSDFTIFDSGNGEYILGLNPFNNIGLYNITVNISGNIDSKTLTINPLSLVVKYNFSGLSGIDSDNLIYYTTSTLKAGLASDAIEVVSSTGSNLIKINASNNGKIYLFVTRKTQNLDIKEKYLKSQTFYSGKNPSFGYNILNDYILKSSLNYKNINIVGDEILNTGSYSLIIKRLKNDTKKTILVSSDVSNYNNKGVKQYG